MSTQNIINAGRASANASVKAFKAQRDNSPKYDQIAAQGLKNRAEEKVAAFRADAKVAKAGLDATAYVQQERIRRDAERDVRGIYKPAKQMKAAAGVVGAAALMLQKDKPQNEIYKAAQAKEIARIQALRSQTYESEGSDPTYLNSLISQRDGLEPPTLSEASSSTSGNSTPSSTGGKTVSSDISAQQSAGPGKLSKAQVKQFAIDAGFTPEQASTVVGIAGGESGFDPTNSTKRSIPGKKNLFEQTGEDSVGLMQINWGYHKDSGWLQKLGITSREQLFDPATNMKAAKYLFDGRGGFGDWTVYNKGIYQDYL